MGNRRKNTSPSAESPEEKRFTEIAREAGQDRLFTEAEIKEWRKSMIRIDPEGQTKAAKSTLAKTLQRLCKECGWTAYKLHKETGIDKKLVLGHMHGKGCSRGTRKTYAVAFTKELGRKIPPDLEG